MLIETQTITRRSAKILKLSRRIYLTFQKSQAYLLFLAQLENFTKMTFHNLAMHEITKYCKLHKHAWRRDVYKSDDN